ncbi:MAG: Smr/MutS family protein [Proteobacteria bacterium]|nr:Smr/MutS family protein [Pseudomonadota bacterium]MBU1610618.1 Smr/MutS family protein [Pseudomonadota bacterium]
MPKNKINSLEELTKLKFKKEKSAYIPTRAPVPVPKVTPQPPEPAEDTEEQLFLSAMHGVERMEGETGRQIEMRPAPPTIPLPEDEEKTGRDHLDALVKGLIEFELEYTEEFMSGFVRGMDSKIFTKLKNGIISHEGSLDLHGLNSEQALDSLLFFLRESYLQGKRCVLLVTGRGIGSPGGQSVLKRAVQGWLTREPLRRNVLAFSTAMPKDGGAGALYVLLRKKKKDVGKVRFNRVNEFD